MQWTMSGFAAACQRLNGLTDVDHLSYAATAEALFWACTVDEGFAELLGETYRTARKSDGAGSVLPGIRWARNRMTHQRALVVDQHYGTELGRWVLGLGVLGKETHIKWASAAEVPAGSNDRGRDVYEDRLSGRPVSQAVESCKQWFFGVTLTELAKASGTAIGDLPGFSQPPPSA